MGDSGVWQHLQAPSLPIADLASLVGATSDNLATNVLLRQVGLPAVRSRTEELGLLRTALLDLVRDSRGPDDAPQLSVGSTAELMWLFSSLARGEVVDNLTSSRVLGWLSDAPIPRDTGDFRLMTRRVLDRFLAMPERHRYVRGMVSWIGYTQVPYRYERQPRAAGVNRHQVFVLTRGAEDARELAIGLVAGL